jgi:hypothetical protein
LKKDFHRLEHLGLTLAETKQLLKLLQKKPHSITFSGNALSPSRES